MASDLRDILAPPRVSPINAPTVVLDEEAMAIRAVLPEGLEVVRPDAAALNEPFAPVAIVYDPERRDEFSIEVHRIEFEAFVSANPAVLGHLFVRGFERIIDAPGYESSLLVHEVAGGRLGAAAGEYEEFVRARAFSTGRIVFIILARTAAEEWDRYADALKTVFESLEYRARFDGESLRVTEFGFAMPTGWNSTGTAPNPTPDVSAGSQTYALGEREYPNFGVQFRRDGLDGAKEAAARQIGAFEASIEGEVSATFTGPAESERREAPDGNVVAYTWVRPWALLDPGLFFASSINARALANEDSPERIDARSVITTLNNTNIIADGIMAEEAEIRELLFRGWAMGSSAENVATISLVEGLDALRGMLRL